jgi:hypothetical protein
MTDKTNKQIAALRAEIDRLKASQPTPHDPAAVGAWRDKMHQLSEARALRQAKSSFSRAELAAMQSAAPDDQCKEIAMRDCRAPQGPSSQGIVPTSQQLSNIRSGAGLIGSNTGWRRDTHLTNPPGTNYADKLMDAQDRRDRQELIQREEAMRRAEQKQRNA